MAVAIRTKRLVKQVDQMMTRPEQAFAIIKARGAISTKDLGEAMGISRGAAYAAARRLAQDGVIFLDDDRGWVAQPTKVEQKLLKVNTAVRGRQSKDSLVRLRSKSRKSGKVVLIINLKHPDSPVKPDEVVGHMAWAITVPEDKTVRFAKSAPEAWQLARST